MSAHAAAIASVTLIVSAVASAVGASPLAGPAPPAAAQSRSTATTDMPDGIPPALQSVTRCMRDAAMATPRVLSAERDASFQDDKAYVEVTYRYRLDDGRVGIATYSRLRDQTPPSDWRGFHGDQSGVLFGTTLSGVFPVCDRDRHGRRDCANVRAWDHSRPQPIPGWGMGAVRSAWQRHCGVETIVLTL